MTTLTLQECRALRRESMPKRLLNPPPKAMVFHFALPGTRQGQAVALKYSLPAVPKVWPLCGAIAFALVVGSLGLWLHVGLPSMPAGGLGLPLLDTFLATIGTGMRRLGLLMAMISGFGVTLVKLDSPFRDICGAYLEWFVWFGIAGALAMVAPYFLVMGGFSL